MKNQIPAIASKEHYRGEPKKLQEVETYNFKMAPQFHKKIDFYKVLPQFGHIVSACETANPQFRHVTGWLLPRGAPHAIHEPSPTGFAVWQNSQATRRNRSESS
jgi:hypothetical protein